jgi:superfamily II DNA or RNA helicase
VATVIIKDEVNCKITDLSLNTRRKLVKEFKYKIPHAIYTPAYKLGRWDGTISFCSLAAVSYVNLLRDIETILSEDNYQLELDDQRDYRTHFEFDPVDENTFSHITWPDKHRFSGEPILLRDYQVEAVNAFLDNPQSIQCLATGSGKTITVAALSDRVQKYGRSIIIVPNKSLITQTEKDYKNLQLDTGVYYGERKEYGHDHTICTWQSLNVLLKSTKEGTADITIQEFLEGVISVIVDECHQVKADVLRDLLTGVMAKIPLRWGLTGTIPPEDYNMQSLNVSIGPVVNELFASELQDRGVLASCHVDILQLKDYAEHNNYQSELKYLLSNPDRLDHIASIISRISDHGNTLVLVDRVSAGKELESRLSNAVFISGATKGTSRQDEYDKIADVNNRTIIATYGVAAVGISIDRLFNLVLIEPGKSFIRVIQSIGRGLRKASDKDFVQIYDITSTCKYAKSHLAKRKKYYKEAGYKYTLKKKEWKS